METSGRQWSPQAASLWAKTGPEPEDWLTLTRHLMDAAEVASLLWREWLAPGVRLALEEALDLQGEGERLVAWLAAVHDLGKATPAFQGQLMSRPGREAFADRVVDAGLPLSGPASATEWHPHSVGSAGGIERWLLARVPGMKAGNAYRLAAIAGAHHGLPAREGEIRDAELFLSTPWRQVQDELLDAMAEYTGAREMLERIPLRHLKREQQMQLTALVILADWIASNQELFPLTAAEEASSRRRAAEAWERLDLAGSWTTRPLPDTADAAYSDRFGWSADRRPWPVQEEVLRAAENLDGPGLLCIEAPMGVGKTEAALLAAEVLARRTGRNGVMVAAPTMATSDGLVPRVTSWAERAGAPGVPASMFLAHSKAALNEDVRTLPTRGLGVRSVGEDEDAPGRRGAVVAHQWLVGRKKGLLSSIAVGTVDQVLFTALQSKHVMLRHLALASKVVVIDEVHAYDAYMSRYLARALTWLGTYGTPVILLSATLPHGAKAELIAAYSSGLHSRTVGPEEVPDTGDAYPVITAAGRQGITATATAPSGRRHTVNVRPMADDDDALSRLMGRVREDGGCLLVVCSTVARAQHAYRLAKEAVGADARLLHARFTAADRVSRERELLDHLGPRAHRGAGRPHRRIVVATQVVEQSLDLDFDVMVTDIAPVDLVLQRCGRVHRHDRPDEDRPAWTHEPQVYVRGMESIGSEEAPPALEPSQARVYPLAALLASAGVLTLFRGGTAVQLPADIPSLVRRAYGGDPALPPTWEESWEQAQAEWEAHRDEQRAKAETFLLPWGRRVSGLEQLWPVSGADVDSLQGEARGSAQVRDADPMLEVLLTREAPGGYVPLTSESEERVLSAGMVPAWKDAQRIAESAVRLPRRFSRPWLFERALGELERQTDLAWQDTPLLRGQLQLALDRDFKATLAGVTLHYDSEFGLTEEKA
ncbi:CRISPR-associated helicase Cas3' [Micrococcus sp.]|uniref:CRISPR-associated helicase Cas3' n=1 Tax=Micrococcus sp. TaxID=1271 RepID=UPI002A9102E1|nr:CRISPR-associated helicase Cas3' [Micrococcus sp.]MDY6054513.1 CRISPR-associated helicase Cas3' [Micrococcus sp.]